MATREDHEVAGGATALDPDAHPVTFELAGASYCITVERAVRLRAELDRQIPSEEAGPEITRWRRDFHSYETRDMPLGADPGPEWYRVAKIKGNEPLRPGERHVG